jgi:hypothetical protein
MKRKKVKKIKQSIRPIFIIIAFLIVAGVLIYHNYQIIKLTNLTNSIGIVVIKLADVIKYLLQKINPLTCL